MTEVIHMRSLVRYFAVFILSVCVITVSQDVHAQSDDDLEEKNQELIEENETLKETIASLEEQIANLEAQLATLNEDEDKDNDESDIDYDQVLSVGDESEVDGITIRVEDAYYTDERNEFMAEGVNEVLIVDIYFENNSGELYQAPLVQDMSLMNGEEYLVTYPIVGMEYEDIEVADGESITRSFAYGIYEDPSTIELEFAPGLLGMPQPENIVKFDVTPE